MSRVDPAAALEFVRLTPEHVDGLHRMFVAIAGAGEEMQFRPHATDHAALGALASDPRGDLYYVAASGGDVVGYGLLRGWSQGYEIPSLGIAIHPQFRGIGAGNALMHFLHAAARLRGCARVRLRVVETNSAAIRLYERVGYRFEAAAEADDDQQVLLVAYKDL